MRTKQGWRELLSDFSPKDLEAWANDLGVETFVGTSGRVFPRTKQAAPLLRRWIARLKKQGVDIRTRHEWTGVKDLTASFATPKGEATINARCIVLALGGGSWPQTGSTAGWIPTLAAAGIEIAPLAAANCGYEVDWPASFQARGRRTTAQEYRRGARASRRFKANCSLHATGWRAARFISWAARCATWRRLRW